MGQVWCLLVASESDALANKAHPQIDPREVLVALSSVGTAWDSLSVGQELQPNTYMQEDDTEPVSYQVRVFCSPSVVSNPKKNQQMLVTGTAWLP